jgi:septum site-determining protein MinD
VGSVIAVLSGKGGTGKTSVCAGVSVALAQSGLRVLCVDCDVGLRNLDISLGLSDSSALSFQDVSEGGYTLEQAAEHPLYPQLRFLTAPMNRDIGQIDFHAFYSMLRQARDMFDYIFLDAPAGVDAGFRLVSAQADRCLVVTGCGPAAVRDAARAGELLELAGKHDVRLIVNRVDRTMLSILDQTIDDVMDEAGLPLLGVVLEDPDVPMAAASGKSLAKYNRRSPAAQCFARIAKRIQGRPEPIKIR